jgi:hypothetical protein
MTAWAGFSVVLMVIMTQIVKQHKILGSYFLGYYNTVKPVLRGHLWDKEKVTL